MHRLLDQDRKAVYANSEVNRLAMQVNLYISGQPELRWTRKIGQEVKLGLLLRRTDLNDGQTEAVFGGIQGEGCS